MKNLRCAVWMAAGLLLAAPAFAQGDDHAGLGQTVVTILPKHGGAPPLVSQQNLNIKINGKEASIANWTQLRGDADRVELVLLIDGEAVNLGTQFEEIKHFVLGLSPQTKVSIGYMQSGAAMLTGPLTTDHARALNGLHLSRVPTASPYFCLADLAKHWPSIDNHARRVVVMLSDGVDPYNLRFDPNDPYYVEATEDSVRAGMIVYPVYWRSMRGNRRVLDGGINLLQGLADATGGYSYGLGVMNPVSFEPYLKDIVLRLDNQYRLGFSARLDRKPEVLSLKLKLSGLSADVTTPQMVFVDHAVKAAE